VLRLVSLSTALAFHTKMSEKHKSTSPSTIQMKNQREVISTEEKLDARSWLEKQEQTLDSLVVAYIQFVIILIELKKVLSQELKCV